MFQENTQMSALWRPALLALAGLVILSALLFSPPASTPAYAYHCVTCAAGDCSATESTIVRDHTMGRAAIKAHMAQAFRLHQQWWQNVFWRQILLPAMMKMNTQLTAVGLYQMMGVGMQFDAKHQLETQLMLQKMQARANRDYTPSKDFCAVGTNTRSLAASSEKSLHNTRALSALSLERQLGPSGSISAEAGADKRYRWDHFVKTYCNKTDNAYQVFASGSELQNLKPEDTGLWPVCEDIADLNRLNIDVDYRRQIEEPLTIDADFTDDAPVLSKKAEDLIALSRNLYGHDVLTRDTPGLTELAGASQYLALRSVAAKRAVAETSFFNIAGMKMAGSEMEAAGGSGGSGGEGRKKTKETMAAILKQMGMPENEIGPFIGEKPSMYAQLEILAKKIFQSTDFMASLYDKPANVERRKVAMAAIGLMIDRAIYESRLRQEMLASVLVSARLNPEFDRVQGALSKTEKDRQ